MYHVKIIMLERSSNSYYNQLTYFSLFITFMTKMNIRNNYINGTLLSSLYKQINKPAIVYNISIYFTKLDPTLFN